MIYTNEMKKFIQENYKGIYTADLTLLFNERFDTNQSATAISAYKKKHQLKNGLVTRYQKGRVPINKGTKGLTGANITSYVKGNISTNIDSVGTEKCLSDGYWYVKVSNEMYVKKTVNWKAKHKLIYENAYGPIPTEFDLMFADGNRSNFDLNNLLLVTKAERLYMSRHDMYNANANITKSNLLIARMMCKSYRKEEKNK